MTGSHVRSANNMGHPFLTIRKKYHVDVLAGVLVVAFAISSLNAALAGNPVKLVPGSTSSTATPETVIDPAAPKPVPVLGLAPASGLQPLQVQQVPQAAAPKPLISPKSPVQPKKPRRIMTLTISKPKSLLTPDTVAKPETSVTPIQVDKTEQPVTGVVVGELTELDPSSVGLLDTATGGFGPHMWRGSDRTRIETMLPRLPMGSLSPTMQSLARRLLLSSSAVPEGKAIAPSLLGLRVERLGAGGLTNETNQLLRLVPARLNDPAFTKAEMEGLLLGGDRASFCVRIEGLVAEDPNPYWLKGLAFCKALEGEVEAVDMAVSILQDQGVTGDETFFTLARALTGDEQAVVQSLIDPTPLQLAMLRAAQQPLPADAVPGASPGILRAEATMANADIELRLAAAEKAETAGALSTELLSQIYAGIQFNEDELQNWQEQFGKMPGARLNALLFQVASVEVDIQKRMVILQRAWQRGRDEGGFGTMARVTYDLARVVEPADDLVWASVDVARALLMAGDVKAARRWFDYVRQLALLPKNSAQAVTPVAPVVAGGVAPSVDPDAASGLPKLATAKPVAITPAQTAPARPFALAAKAVLDLWPMMQLADFTRELGWNPQAVDAWFPLQQKLLGEAVAAERSALLFILFDALGYGLPDAAWDGLLQGSLTITAYVPSPALVRSLESAALNKRLGETVLLGLLALGDVGPAGAAPSTLRSVIRAFNTVGLQAEARALALESVLGRGF
jgi:hypothetical protein